MIENHHSFENMGIFPDLLSHLKQLNYTSPTPIQKKSIPVLNNGEDIIGIAQTGTGKTLAFAVPLLQHISEKKGQGLVLLPTRELALQVEETFKKLGKPFGLKTALLIGGMSYYIQNKSISQKPHVVIATPGRLNDHIKNKTISLDRVCVLVFDEADRMFDMGFEPQIREIVKSVPKKRQTMLFSATMPHAISELAKHHMKNPVRIEVAPAGSLNTNIDQEFFLVHKDDKIRLLEKVLTEYKGAILVFTRTKHGAKRLSQQIQQLKHTACELHSNRTLAQRTQALNGFKSGLYRVLVATDIASRGIDVKNIELVINFDLPDASEDYVHRIGRTGRAGKSGKAITFVTSEQKRDLRSIEKLISQKILLQSSPSLPERKQFEKPIPQEPIKKPFRKFQKHKK